MSSALLDRRVEGQSIMLEIFRGRGMEGGRGAASAYMRNEMEVPSLIASLEGPDHCGG